MKTLKTIILTIMIMALVFSGCSKMSSDDADQDSSESTVHGEPATETESDSEEYTVAEEAEEESEDVSWIRSLATSQPKRGESADEQYGKHSESEFFSPLDVALSTFSIDVDTASYSNSRRFLKDDSLPPIDAVRVEEFINYFSYDYPEPRGNDPVSIGVMISECPWNEDRLLARVSLKAIELDLSEAPNSNLVFLLDVSGSMNDPDKLPLVKSAIKMLTENLSSDDTISIVVYAGASGVVLEGSEGDDLYTVENILDRLNAGGSTAGGAGINLAYAVAEDYFIRGGNNRVILCTDGDFNVGLSSNSELENLIEKKRESDIFLSVLGFGEGNVKDEKMETLADKGNGNYAYIDSLMEAKKVLVNEITSTLFTVAKDVKIQVEFNPDAIKEYRLVGYDNRVLNAEDFNDDKKDAGEMGAGHTVTAFYELILTSGVSSKEIDELVFQDKDNSDEPIADDWLYVKMRYKEPDEDESKKITIMAGIENYTQNPDDDFVFATAAVEFALLLKDSRYKSDATYENVIYRAKRSKGYDEEGYRSEFIRLVETAEILSD